MFARRPGFRKEGTNRVMKLNAKISEIASPETVFDKKITSRVCHLHRQTRRSTVWASSEQNVGLVDFVPEFAEKRPRSGGRGGVGGKRGGYFLKRRNIFISPYFIQNFFDTPPPLPPSLLNWEKFTTLPVPVLMRKVNCGQYDDSDDDDYEIKNNPWRGKIMYNNVDSAGWLHKVKDITVLVH